MKSMTGFGVAQSRSNEGAFEVQVRSVNGRFLETRIHLPREFTSLEASIKKSLSGHFRRGTCDVFVHRKSKSSEALRVKLNEALCKQYLREIEALEKLTKKQVSSDLSLSTLLRMPEIFQLEEEEKVKKKSEKLLLRLVDQAIKACLAQREMEGRALVKELGSLLSQLEKTVRVLEKERVKANRLLEKRLWDRLKARGQEVGIEPQRVAQELVIFLDKSCIDEELVRLREHLRTFREHLKSKETEGKTLDFFCQELLREVNTIGSKSQVAKMTQAVVGAKGLIEKIREQVQNLE